MNPGDLPSAAQLTELVNLSHLPEQAQRARRAWQLVLATAANVDFPMVIDFALGLGLIRPCSSGSWVNPIDGSEMIWIPPGPFHVGEDRRHAESAGFSLARFPVTNVQFQGFLQQTGYSPADPCFFLQHWQDGKIPPGLEAHPVVWISYLDALHYCRWAGLTLPTEWLWEKAARGPDGRPYPWGTQPPLTRVMDWHARRQAVRSAELTNVASAGTCAVGRYPRTRTPYGCEDLLGNISEWCQPATSQDPGALPPPTPPLPDTTGYAPVRGSCFLRVDTARMPSWHRRRLSVTRRNRWVGFRPALFLPCRPAE